MESYDVCVIGSGPGGYVAAIRCAQLGARVAVVERADLGGVCLNVGCIPTKTLIHSAELYRKLCDAPAYGLRAEAPGFDMAALVKRKNEVVALNTGGIANLFKARGIAVLPGEARVTGAGEVSVAGAPVRAKSIIVATGGRPADIPGMSFNGKTVIGSTEALELTSLPKRIAVIGAGPLGAEFACIWNAFGAEVTLVEALDQVLPKEDEELTKRLGASFKRRGMDVRTGTKVARLKEGKDGVRLTLEGKGGGEQVVDLVLVGIGLRCNSECVADLGLTLGARGGIPVDDRMETPVRGVYAIGDVVDKTWLAHGASAEAMAAAANACGGDARMRYEVTPRCSFTSPELASVGLTEAEAAARGIKVKTGRFLFNANGRAHAMGETEGMVKIVGDAATDELLGLHVLGAEAGELISAGALAMRLEATVGEVAHTIFTHPTLSEAIKEAAEDYFGESIHTPPRRR